MGKKKTQELQEEDLSGEEPQQDEESYSERPKNKKKSVKKEPKAANPKKSEPKKAEPKKVNVEKKEKPKAENEQKQNKKKDFLPGQKYPTPDDEDGALAFYKSLYEKNPRSEMARKYCLEYGVLQPQQATRLLKEMSKTKK